MGMMMTVMELQPLLDWSAVLRLVVVAAPVSVIQVLMHGNRKAALGQTQIASKAFMYLYVI